MDQNEIHLTTYFFTLKTEFYLNSLMVLEMYVIEQTFVMH